ncbi:MAG: hypothetical protein ACREN5_04070 [Gemmatimonadales bacterium]
MAPSTVDVHINEARPRGEAAGIEPVRAGGLQVPPDRDDAPFLDEDVRKQWATREGEDSLTYEQAAGGHH